MIGQTIGKYRFVEELARDGQTAVYKAIDETLGREVAVKVLNPQADREVLKHFQAEATTLARLNHPDIVGIHEIQQTESDLLLVMELVRGETLDQLAARCGPLPPERAAYLVAQVLGALVHAHAANVVHRNLKPSNVTVTEQGGIKVHDFGMSRVAAEDQMTSDGFTLGSPAYMAPEQLLGQTVDARADVYSAGVIFYYLLTGRLPFTAPTPLEMIQRQLSGTPTPATTYRPELPGWCQAILDRALARSAADRFQTAEAFRSTLLAAISEATESTGVFAAVQGTSAFPAAASPVSASATGQQTVVAQTPATGGALAPAAAWTPPHASFPTPAPAASPVPVAPMAAAPPRAPVPAAGEPKKVQFAAVAGLLGALVVAIAIVVVIALRRNNEVPVAPATSATPVQETSAPATAAATTAAAPAPVTPATPRPAPVVIDPSPLVLPPTAAAAAPAPVAPRPSPSTSTHDATPLTFSAKAVVADGDKRRERDAVVLVADGMVSVKEKGDKGKALYALPIDGLVTLTYSKSRQPLWSSPDGPAEAMRVEGGTFGFLKGGGERDWVGLRTKESLLVLRIEDDQVESVTDGLEKRTGLTLERLAERKN